MKLFLIRHGESEFNRIGEEAGSDSPLSERGLLQAEQLATWLRQRGPFDAFYCSSLVRARQTADPIARQVQAPPMVVMDSLREADIHLIDILPQAAHPLDVLRQPGQPALPEAYDRFRQQIEGAIRTIVDAGMSGQHERVLVVSHGAALGTLIRCLVGCHRISIWSLNCCVHLLAWTDNRWEMRYLNRVDFLDDELCRPR